VLSLLFILGQDLVTILAFSPIRITPIFTMASVSPLPSISTPATSVTSKAQSVQPTIRFESVEKLYQAIDNVPGDLLAVTGTSPFGLSSDDILTQSLGVSSTDFDEIDISRQCAHPCRKFRLRRYNADTRMLIITIPTSVHEALHAALYNTLIIQFAQSGLHGIWLDKRSTTYRSPGHPRGHDGGEGDSTGGPIPERIGTSWPTLVIEAGYSETLHELRNDMRWWFSASDHQVKIVILAKSDHTQRAILLEKWEEAPSHPRPGATTTRHAAALQPMMRQSITITENATTDPATYLVTRGPLVLSFRLLFLRDPDPLQGDVVVDVEKLEDYARRVWLSAPAV